MYAVMYHTCTVYTNFGLELILKIYVLSARERDFIVSYPGCFKIKYGYIVPIYILFVYLVVLCCMCTYIFFFLIFDFYKLQLIYNYNNCFWIIITLEQFSNHSGVHFFIGFSCNSIS